MLSVAITNASVSLLGDQGIARRREEQDMALPPLCPSPLPERAGGMESKSRFVAPQITVNAALLLLIPAADTIAASKERSGYASATAVRRHQRAGAARAPSALGGDRPSILSIAHGASWCQTVPKCLPGDEAGAAAGGAGAQILSPAWPSFVVSCALHRPLADLAYRILVLRARCSAHCCMATSRPPPQDTLQPWRA